MSDWFDGCDPCHKRRPCPPPCPKPCPPCDGAGSARARLSTGPLTSGPNTNTIVVNVQNVGNNDVSGVVARIIDKTQCPAEVFAQELVVPFDTTSTTIQSCCGGQAIFDGLTGMNELPDMFEVVVCSRNGRLIASVQGFTSAAGVRGNETFIVKAAEMLGDPCNFCGLRFTPTT
jgi:hypothetical protein